MTLRLSPRVVLALICICVLFPAAAQCADLKSDFQKQMDGLLKQAEESRKAMDAANRALEIGKRLKAERLRRLRDKLRRAGEAREAKAAARRAREAREARRRAQREAARRERERRLKEAKDAKAKAEALRKWRAQQARERAARIAAENALKARLRLERCKATFASLIAAMGKDPNAKNSKAAKSLRVCGAFTLDAAIKEANRLAAIERKKEAEAARKRSEEARKEMARIRELRRREAEERRLAEIRRIAKEKADRIAAAAVAEAVRKQRLAAAKKA